MKSRLFLMMGLIAAMFVIVSWRADRAIFGQDVAIPEQVFDSPFGQFTLPTVDGTPGILNKDYQLAEFAFGVKTAVPQLDDLAGDTGNGFFDRYDYENLDLFPTLAQPANQVGDLDSLDEKNEVVVGGMIVNPGFRFVHIGRNAIVWRVGKEIDDVLSDEVIVFPSLDHLAEPEYFGFGPYERNPPPGGLGNAALEALEFTVFGTNDVAEASLAAVATDYFGQGGIGELPNERWVRATLTTVYADGFKDYNGTSPLVETRDDNEMSPQEGDDFASRWQFRDTNGNPVPVKFVAIYANRTRDERFYKADSAGNVPGRLAPSNEAEIDAVGFKQYVRPVITPTPVIEVKVAAATGYGSILRDFSPRRSLMQVLRF